MDNCVVCNEALESGESEFGVEACTECSRIYPPSLIKACFDEFDYALGLKDGRILRISHAKVYGDWVRVWGQEYVGDEHCFEKDKEFPFSCPRGLDIKFDDIVWFADAPDGS